MEKETEKEYPKSDDEEILIIEEENEETSKEDEWYLMGRLWTKKSFNPKGLMETMKTLGTQQRS